MTATQTALATTASRAPTLEELVDRLLAPFFTEEENDDESAPLAESLAKAIHNARRLRAAGDLDEALAVLRRSDLKGADDSTLRWAFAEFVDVAKRRHADDGAYLYSPSTGRAAVLAPVADRGALEVRAVLGMRWRAGKRVSKRSLRGLKSLTKGGQQ